MGEPVSEPPDADGHETGHALLPPAYERGGGPEPTGDGGDEWPVVGDDEPFPPPRPSARSRSRGRRRRLRHPILTSIGVLVVIVVLLAVAVLVWAQSQINPGGHRGPDVTVTIPAGSSTSRIGKILASAGVIHEGTLFALYVRLHGDGPLYPGKYTLAKNSPYQAAISALEAGPKVVTDTLVIPEGFTVEQIAARIAALPGLHLSAQKFLAAANSGTVRSPYEQAGVNNLEGLLFPATYKVHQGESEVEVLEQMVGTFDTQADAVGLQAAAAKLGFTAYQIVTVASIVEKEAKLPGDRGPVASVLFNRLHAGMSLGADSTQTYYLRLRDPGLGVPTAAQDDQPSPYNTRINKGLPPTPIANPGLASLQAATQPPSTPYLYFVEVNPDGQLGFASTQAGFDQLQARCRAAGLC